MYYQAYVQFHFRPQFIDQWLAQLQNSMNAYDSKNGFHTVIMHGLDSMKSCHRMQSLLRLAIGSSNTLLDCIYVWLARLLGTTITGRLQVEVVHEVERLQTASGVTDHAIWHTCMTFALHVVFALHDTIM